MIVLACLFYFLYLIKLAELLNTTITSTYTMQPTAQIRQSILVTPSVNCATLLNDLIPIITNRKLGDAQNWMHDGSINYQKDKSLDQNQTLENVQINLIDKSVRGKFN